jgi:dephospho-CoA kinase
MRIIGLTGPSGAGKSTLCEKFEELGIPCINTDDIYHEITSKPSPCLKELEKAFGSAVINENGSLDRTALARLVFEGEKAKENLDILNSITHKYVWEETNARLTQYMKKRKKAAVIDAPALFSSRVFIGACSFIISVLCDKETRIERIVARDGITREQALARINAQPDDEFFIKNSDYYINNSGNKSEMSRQLASIFEQEGMFF